MIYVSVDVEADGPIPGTHSLLSIGAVVLDPEMLAEVDRFAVNLDLLADGTPDEGTSRWWAGHPKAWAAHRRDTETPAQAMLLFSDWLDCLRADRGRLVPLAAPASFDFPWLRWYCHHFLAAQPLGLSCLDLWSYGAALLGVPPHRARKKAPAEWTSALPHTHVAVEDAAQQADVFARMLDWQRGREYRLREAVASVLSR